MIVLTIEVIERAVDQLRVCPRHRCHIVEAGGEWPECHLAAGAMPRRGARGIDEAQAHESVCVPIDGRSDQIQYKFSYILRIYPLALYDVL